MAKKDFSALNTEKQETGTETGAVCDTIERGKNAFQRQPTASPEEQTERAAKLRTQGRKGCKGIRINMIFTPENHQYIRVMSQVTGQTMAKFINDCIQEHREEHPDIYEAAKGVIAMLDKTKEQEKQEGQE